MPRILGINIPDNKKIEISLSYIYGIGRESSAKVLDMAGIDLGKRAKELTAEEINKIHQIVEKNYRVEGDLRREVTMNIKRLKEIGAYRGIRHSKGLPSRGQRTKTNTRTVRGNVRRTVGSGRSKASEKT